MIAQGFSILPQLISKLPVEEAQHFLNEMYSASCCLKEKTLVNLLQRLTLNCDRPDAALEEG